MLTSEADLERKLIILKGFCHEHHVKIQEYKNTFTATETYKQWSSFGKNYNVGVMKLKKKRNDINTIPPRASRSELEKVCLTFSSYLILPRKKKLKMNYVPLSFNSLLMSFP